MSQRRVHHRILLTGAAGFIGSHLARLLVADGQDVTAILRPGEDRWRIADIESSLCTVEGDLRDLPSLAARIRTRRPTICIHLAWQGWKGTAEDNLSSLAVSLELLGTMRDLACHRFVGAGTCFEYDLTQDHLDETARLRPHGVYGACKKSLFEVAQQFSAVTGMSAVTPRIFYTYGPHEDPKGLVPYAVLSLLRGTAADFTPGAQVRDYVHVDDIASALWTIAQSDVTGAVNIASGESVTVGQIALRIGQLLEKPHLIRLGTLKYREGEPMRIVGDAALLRQRLGWSPRFDIDRGLAQTVDWWRERIDHV